MIMIACMYQCALCNPQFFLAFIQLLFWGLKYRTYLNVLHKVNVVGITGINISASRATSDMELEKYLTSNGVKLDMDNMWLGDEIRQATSTFCGYNINAPKTNL